MAQNGYYNNPAFAQAAANLSSLFAPPSGSDAAGWAMARERQMKADQLKWLFDNYQDPSASARSALTGVQGYGSTPSGFAATDATNRFKITTDDATNRYKVEQDNARAMAQTQAEQAGQTTRTLLDPVGQGQTRFVPPGVAGVYNIPQTQVGAISVNPGERIVTPDGRTIEGAPKLPTEDQMKGIAFGRLSPEEQRAVTIGNTPVENIQTPSGPRIAWRADTPGQQPYLKPDGSQATEVAKLIAERDALPQGDPNRAAYDARIAALGRGQQQSAYDKATDEDLAKLGTTIYTQAQNAAVDSGLYNTILAAVSNPNVDQGTFGQATLGLRKLLNGFGIDAGNTAPAEMINSLGGQLALRLRGTDGGAGMPGSLSDSDREFLRSMSVSLGNSRDANKLIGQYYLAAQQRASDLEQMRSDYVAQHGRLDEGFRAQVSVYNRTADPTLGVRSQIAGAMRAMPTAPQAQVPAAPMAPAPPTPQAAVPQAPGRAGWQGQRPATPTAPGGVTRSGLKWTVE